MNGVIVTLVITARHWLLALPTVCTPSYSSLVVVQRSQQFILKSKIYRMVVNVYETSLSHVYCGFLARRAGARKAKAEPHIKN